MISPSSQLDSCPPLTTIFTPAQIFEGHPSLKHFSLWSPNATFTDPLTVATGHAKYTAQFYGLPALFKPIQIQHHRVTSAGNPLELELSNKYVVKGIKKEQTMNSVVKVFIGEDGKVERLEDRWNGKLPEGAISDVSSAEEKGGWSPFALVWWGVAVGRDVAWSTFCTVSWWSPFLVGRPAFALWSFLLLRMADVVVRC